MRFQGVQGGGPRKDGGFELGRKVERVQGLGLLWGI